MSVGDCAVSFF